MPAKRNRPLERYLMGKVCKRYETPTVVKLDADIGTRYHQHADGSSAPLQILQEVAKFVFAPFPVHAVKRKQPGGFVETLILNSWLRNPLCRDDACHECGYLKRLGREGRGTGNKGWVTFLGGDPGQ